MFIKCMHPDCYDEGTVRVNLYKRGGRAAYLCNYHAFHLESYSSENDNRHGKTKVNPYTFGHECESVDASIKARVEMCGLGFTATSDCSLGVNGVEFKSPIYEGMNAIIKQANSIERLLMNGDMVKDERSGDHTHVGNRDMINEETIQYIRRFYHSLFLPLCEAMKEDEEGTKKLFGRYFTGYAHAINENSSPMTHENYINLQHSYTIEYRLCKFRSAEQFQNLVRFCKAITEAICNNFVTNFNDIPEGKEATKWRKQKANVAANKMVKLFKKYVETAPDMETWITG